MLGRGHDGSGEPDPNERQGKDVVRVDPHETVRIRIRFGDHAGQFPWHCHILEHEDHEMMRPFEVVTGDGDENGECERDETRSPSAARRRGLTCERTVQVKRRFRTAATDDTFPVLVPEAGCHDATPTV